MSDDLDRLIAVLEPPAQRVEPEMSCAELEGGEWGLQVSPEVREIFDTYGSGVIGRHLMLYDPRTFLTLDQFQYRLIVLHDMSSDPADYFPPESPPPLPPFPGPGERMLMLADDGNTELFVTAVDGVMEDGALRAGDVGDQMWRAVEGPVARNPQHRSDKPFGPTCRRAGNLLLPAGTAGGRRANVVPAPCSAHPDPFWRSETRKGLRTT